MRTTFHHPHGYHAARSEQDVEARLAAVLDRFQDAITSVHVTMEDLNGQKGGVDKSCKLELHGSFETVVVTATHEHILGAVDAAVHKAATAVDRARKRHQEHRG